jgi:hypothetical protein
LKKKRILPLLNSLNRKDSPTERSMALLVEMYLQYIATMPSALVEALKDTEVGFEKI